MPKLPKDAEKILSRYKGPNRGPLSHDDMSKLAGIAQREHDLAMERFKKALKGDDDA